MKVDISKKGGGRDVYVSRSALVHEKSFWIHWSRLVLEEALLTFVLYWNAMCKIYKIVHFVYPLEKPKINVALNK